MPDSAIQGFQARVFNRIYQNKNMHTLDLPSSSHTHILILQEWRTAKSNKSIHIPTLIRSRINPRSSRSTHLTLKLRRIRLWREIPRREASNRSLQTPDPARVLAARLDPPHVARDSDECFINITADYQTLHRYDFTECKLIKWPFNYLEKSVRSVYIYMC